MSCLKFAIMPSPFVVPSFPSASQQSFSMACNRQQDYTRNPRHQNTWPLMTGNIGAPTAPASANPFSPTPQVQTVRNVSEIIPRLYISDLAFAENPSLLASYRITHVLSTLPDTIFCPPPTLLPFQPVRLQIRVDDLPFAELAAHLPTTTSFIRDALSSNSETRILVHCGEGISRSVSVVAAFLMAQYNWTPMEAIQYIKGKRRVAEPNFGFVQQLHEYARDGLGRAIQNPSFVGHVCGQSMA